MATMYAGRNNYYFLNIDANTVLDAGRKGSEARFANHCCDPVCPLDSLLIAEREDREMDREGGTADWYICGQAWNRSGRRNNLW
jgi:hypothetical protein